MSKVFDTDHYDSDDWAKYLVLGFLETKGYKVWVNPDRFGIDLLAERRGKKFQFEVEVKHNWHGIFFPFERIHYSARKLKFIDLDSETWFVTLNDEQDRAVFIGGDHLLLSPIIYKRTKYTENEPFVEVDIQWGIFRTLEEGR